MPVTHLVLWELADPAATSAELLAKLQQLRSGFSAILRFDATPVSSPDTGFNFVLHSEFTDWQSLKEYMQAPAHIELVEYIRTIAIRKNIIDYEQENNENKT